MALWTPTEITTALWFDASDSSTLYDATVGGSLVGADGLVARWNDKSGNARNLLQATSGARPIRKVAEQNSKDVLRFDGIAQFLDTNNFATALTQPYQIIIAAKLTGTPTLEADLIGGGETVVSVLRPRWSGGSALMFAGAVLTQPSIGAGTYILGGVFNGASSRFLLDGDIKASGNAGTASLAKIRVARQTNNVQTAYMACDVYEAVVISTNSVDERQLTEGYIAWRWGLQGSLPAGHPYKNAAPSTGGSSAAAVHFFTFGF